MRILKRTIFLTGLAMLAGCEKDPLEGLVPGTGPEITDDLLKVMSQPRESGWRYFANETMPFARASTSPHPETLIRVLYNAFASSQLDATGRVRAGALFPDSSVIVKELYNGATLSTTAIMMKYNGSRSAGFGGWIWAVYRPDGTVEYSTTGRGAACSACHSRGIDYTRMNDSH